MTSTHRLEETSTDAEIGRWNSRGLVVEITEVDGVVTVTVNGDIDMATAPTLRAALHSVDVNGTVIVDCANVQFMDSSGIAALITAASRLTAHGGSLCVHRPSASVRRVLAITGVQHFIQSAEPNSECSAINNADEAPNMRNPW